jgi:hypothetical protein
MQIVEWWKRDGKKPFGIIGLDNDEKLFIKGLDEQYFLDDLSANVEDESGVQLTEKDGTKFLEAVISRYTNNVYEQENDIRGPFEVKILPELEEISDD